MQSQTAINSALALNDLVSLDNLDSQPKDADGITILQADKLLVKTWSADGTIKAYGNAKNFGVRLSRVSGIEQLSKLLAELEADPKSCIVRGSFVGFEEARRRENL